MGIKSTFGLRDMEISCLLRPHTISLIFNDSTVEQVEQILENVELHKYVSKPCPSTSVQLMKTQPLRWEFWLTAECVVLWSSAGWRSVGFQGLFTGSRRHAVDLNATEFKKQKKNVIMLATHPHDSVFRFKWPFLLCSIIKCTSFSGCRSIQITLKGPGERLHILYKRRQLRCTSLLQVSTM